MNFFRDLIKEVKLAIAVLRFNKAEILAVSNRRESTKWGIIILLIPIVFSLILGSLIFPSGFSSIFSRFLFWPIVIPVISLGASFFTMSFLSQKFFGSSHKEMEFVRVMAYGSIILWLIPIGFLLDLLGLAAADSLAFIIWVATGVWLGILAYKTFLDYRLVQPNAIWTVVLGVLIYLIFNWLLGHILVGSYYQMFNF